MYPCRHSNTNHQINNFLSIVHMILLAYCQNGIVTVLVTLLWRDTMTKEPLRKESKTFFFFEADSPRRSRRLEIIKLRAEINKIETQKTIQKINETKSWFLEKINKIDKPLAKLIKRQRENTQINKIRNKKGDITTDTEEIQRIIRSYYESLYAT